MSRVTVVKGMLGLYGMIACACRECDDEEILEACNSLNPSGTRMGWGQVVRTVVPGLTEASLPVQCADDPQRVHYVVLC